MICTEDKGSDYQPSPGQCHLPGELHAGGCDESLSVQVAITKLELKVGLAKVKNRFGSYVWKVRKCLQSGGRHYKCSQKVQSVR